MEKQHMNPIDFSVPLSRSKLFDLVTQVTAMKLCAKFPGLKAENKEDCVHIYGELNDYWYSKWNLAVFEIGSLDIDLD